MSPDLRASLARSTSCWTRLFTEDPFADANVIVRAGYQGAFQPPAVPACEARRGGNTERARRAVLQRLRPVVPAGRGRSLHAAATGRYSSYGPDGELTVESCAEDSTRASSDAGGSRTIPKGSVEKQTNCSRRNTATLKESYAASKCLNHGRSLP